MLFLVGLETIPSFGKFTYSIIAVDYLIFIFSFFLLFYSFYFFIRKEHLNKKGIRTLIIFGLLYILIIIVPIAYIYVFLIAKEVFNLNGNAFLLEFTKYCLSFLETSFLFALLGAFMKIALLWYDNVMKQKEMEKQLIAGELALLRSQINPQFLFNTLTSIRTLIELKPDKAIYSIENLSEIMSYMLYETNAEKVFLDDEIEYINNYLNLQRVRYNPDYISFDVKNDASGIMVPPMIFMPFLEHVFSYKDIPERTPGIVINLNLKGGILTFEVINFIKENADMEKSDNSFSIKSITRRLDLLFGINNYTLDLISENNKKLLKLRINL